MRTLTFALAALFLLTSSAGLVACESADEAGLLTNGDTSIGANLDGSGGGSLDAGPVVINCSEHVDCASAAVAGSCELGMCDLSVGICITTPMPDDSVCTNAGECWSAGLCQAGTCMGNVPADDGVTCHVNDACGSGGKCMDGECLVDGSENACDDGDPCSVDICSDEAGGCVYQSQPDETACSTECIPEGMCQAGSCVGEAIDGCEDEPNPDWVCGDGDCSPGESPKTCPEDCDITVEDPMTCVEAHCGDELDACMADEGCSLAVGCMQACDLDTEQECLDACTQAMETDGEGVFWAVYDCGHLHTCFDDEPDSCGNGNCDPGENLSNCPQDCNDQPPGPGPCLETHCGGEVASCLGDPGCSGIIGCMDACEDQECDYACILEAGEESADKFMALVGCGDQHGCFDGGGGGEPVCGNGVCEQGENGFNCDEDCKPPPGSCGNQECEDGETPQNCPTDCESDEPPGGETIACLQDKCGPSFFGCIEDEACVGIIECMQQCETDECEQGCFANVSQSSFGKFMDLVECGDAEGCFGGPGGGDGTDPPEDPTLQCIEEQCGNEYGDCFNDEGCTAILECMAQCAPDDDGCNDNCVWTAGGWGGNNTFWALADCAETEGCLDQGNDGGGDGGGGGDGADWECGDGQCDPGENFFCPQDC